MSGTAATSPPTDPSAALTATREFDVDGARWIARVAGEAVGGTGRQARAYLVSVLFAPAEEPDAPRREALLPRGRLEDLYPEELVSLFRRARPLPLPDERA